MGTRILGWIGILWGGAIVAGRLLGSDDGATGAYAAGRNAGLVFGILLLGVGAYYAFRRAKRA
jgi:hypothetical protein